MLRALALACALALAGMPSVAHSQEPTRCLSPDLLTQTFTEAEGAVRVLEPDEKVRAAHILSAIKNEIPILDWSFVLYVTFDAKTPGLLLYGMGECMALRLAVPPNVRPQLERALFGEPS